MPGSARAVHRGHVGLAQLPSKNPTSKRGSAPIFDLICPVSISENAQFQIDGNNERLAIASLFPRPKGSIRHTRVDCTTVFRSARSPRPRARANRKFSPCGRSEQTSAQRNIQPAQRIHTHAVAGIDQHGRGLGFDDRRPGQRVARLQRVERIDGNVAPGAEKGLPLALR